jgi:hypothetical protein
MTTEIGRPGRARPLLDRTSNMRTPALFALALASTAASTALSGCADPSEDGDPDDSIAVDDGKADDFFSVTAQEWTLEGRSSITLDASLATASEATRTAAAKKLISYKQIAISWFVTQYFVDKEEEDENYKFGGFGGIAKGGMWEDLSVTARADKLTYDFTFKQLLAGPKTLLSKLPVRTENGKSVFDLEIGKPTNDEMSHLTINEEWYRNAPWSAWDPAKVTADKKEKITFSIGREKESTDAFFDMKKLAADGKIDIDVYFGWDYHDNFHIQHSKAFFTWLKSQGFRAPVASWDAMTKDTAPFTRTLKADGQSVTVEVRFYFGKPGTNTDPDTDAGGKVLEDIARAALKTRDVVIYSGHSGPFYGFALANWRKTTEGDLDDAEMRTIPLASKYQIVVAEGCETYQIGEAFLQNPAKAGKNVDIITTNSFSNAATPATVEDFIKALLAHDSSNRLRPQVISRLLTELDSESSWGFHTMYGIHGIDQDPKLHPFANTAAFGTKCTSNAQCGGPGNLCVTMGTLGKRCTAACAVDAGCPTSYTCKAVASSSTSTIYGRACAKSM